MLWGLEWKRTNPFLTNLKTTLWKEYSVTDQKLTD